MNVNTTQMLNLTNVNFVLIYINYVPIFGNSYIQEDFRSLATANSAVVSSITHP